VLVNLRESSLGVQVLRDCYIVHRFKLQVLEGGRRDGEFLLEGLPDIGGVGLILVRMDQGGVDGHSESANGQS